MVNMKAVYENAAKHTVIFTDEGISYYTDMQDTYYPYGCLDSVSMSLLGVLQIVYKAQVACFTVEKKDRGAMRETVRQARERMKTAPEAPRRGFLKNFMVPNTLPAEEQLRRYKELYVQGKITKEEYDLKHRYLKRD